MTIWKTTENNLIPSGLLKISFQIFKVDCFTLRFTSTSKTELSYRTLAKEVLRTADSSVTGYMRQTGNTQSKAQEGEQTEPLIPLPAKKHPKVGQSFFLVSSLC